MGNGLQIFLGIDLIVGITGDYRLFGPLITQLHNKNIFVLAQIRRMGCGNSSSPYWYQASKLGLSDEVNEKCNCFVMALNKVGIVLSTEAYTLV